jgi:hypothetical protein
LEQEELWEFVQLDEDDASFFVVVFLTSKIVDMIRRAKTKALSTIKLSVKYQVILYILSVRNLKECWDVFKKHFEVSNNIRRLVVHDKFSNLRMEKGSSVANFMHTIQNIVI